MSENNLPSTGQVDVANINHAAQSTLIHVDLTNTLYGISSTELKIIEEGSSSIYKDIFLSGFGIGIPCLINAIIEYQKDTKLNSEVFWNSLIAGISIVLAIVFCIIYRNSTNNCKILIDEIKQRPKYRMN